MYPTGNVGQSNRVPDIRARSPDTWVYVEVTQPEQSEAGRRAQSVLRATVDLMEGIKQSFNSEPPERSSRRSFSTKAPALVTPSKLASRCPVLTTASVAPTPTSLAKPPLLQIGWGRALACPDAGRPWRRALSLPA
jgi:hypothetical protein